MEHNDLTLFRIGMLFRCVSKLRRIVDHDYYGFSMTPYQASQSLECFHSALLKRAFQYWRIGENNQLLVAYWSSILKSANCPCLDRRWKILLEKRSGTKVKITYRCCNTFFSLIRTKAYLCYSAADAKDRFKVSKSHLRESKVQNVHPWQNFNL